MGKLIFTQIEAAWNGRDQRKTLIFPNLIFSLLISQGFKSVDHEVKEPFKETIKVDARLLSGRHVQINKDHEPEVAILVQNDHTELSHPSAASMQLNYIRQELMCLTAMEE